jgi:hypothetical protein
VSVKEEDPVATIHSIIEMLNKEGFAVTGCSFCSKQFPEKVSRCTFCNNICYPKDQRNN